MVDLRCFIDVEERESHFVVVEAVVRIIEELHGCNLENIAKRTRLDRNRGVVRHFHDRIAFFHVFLKHNGAVTLA